ncbi:hypothetical protein METBISCDRAFT_21191 [Metschnikowia bicuspidata]|uniref:HAD-like protein n=1 Tax=Metschnikowia bicuspidata TaxID=27322 RepID=A0A4V1J3R0_9ASCO|nr:hypothetical protein METBISCDRAFT_21191 [Metschnikowia bicuspidata]
MSVPAIVFTDWDGTVTLQDSNDYLTENLGFGRSRRLEINDEILNGKKSFKDGFSEMLKSIPTPFPECIDYLLKHVDLDPGFKEFYSWCVTKNIPVVVISSGMAPIIKALLGKLVGTDVVENIKIISNSVKIDDVTGAWEIVYKDSDTGFGHDKSKSIREYLAKKGFSADHMPPVFYCGDGVSDVSAAKETKLLFAKEGRDLIIHCKRENIPYTTFSDFSEIFAKVKSIVEDKKPISDYILN